MTCFILLNFMEEEKTRTKEIKEDSKDLVEHVTDLLETYSKLVIINATQKGIDISSSIIFSVTLAFLGFLVVSFIGFGLACRSCLIDLISCLTPCCGNQQGEGHER